MRGRKLLQPSATSRVPPAFPRRTALATAPDGDFRVSEENVELVELATRLLLSRLSNRG
jgi:hypothetical protein